MATYNGERFLEPQLESLIRQSYSEWRLLVHDDGSSDNSIKILKQFRNRYPNKISIIEDNIRTGSAKNNFFHLMSFVNTDYVMLCDQDDVWFNDKIEVTLQKIQESEANFTGPIAAYTDLCVVDEKLSIISNSMKKRQKLRHAVTLNDILLSNCVSGCTLMLNRPATKLLTFPAEAIMHDWWFAIEIVRNNGILLEIKKPTIYYRQHAHNAVGSKRVGWLYTLGKIAHLAKTLKNIADQYAQYRHVLGQAPLQFGLGKLKHYYGSHR